MDYNTNYYTESELLFNLLEFENSTTLGYGIRYRTVTIENKNFGWAMLNEKYSPEVFIYSENTINEVTTKIKIGYSIIHEYINPSPTVSLHDLPIQSRLVFNDANGVIFTFDVFATKVDYCSCKAVVYMNKFIFSIEDGFFVPDIINFVEYFSNTNDFIFWMDTFYNRRWIDEQYLITYLGYDFTFTIPNDFEISNYQGFLAIGLDPIEYFNIEIIK